MVLDGRYGAAQAEPQHGLQGKPQSHRLAPPDPIAEDAADEGTGNIEAIYDHTPPQRLQQASVRVHAGNDGRAENAKRYGNPVVQKPLQWGQED